MPLTLTGELVSQNEYRNALEDAIAECMRRQGFDYRPTLVDGIRQAESLGYDLSPERYAERFGFGIAGGFLASVVPLASGPVYGQGEELSSTTPEEREAYLVALEGPDVLNVDAVEIEIGGCRAQAVEEVEAPRWIQERDWLETAGQILFDRLAADPRMVEIEGEWAECMSTEGFAGLINKRLLLDALLEEFDGILARLEPSARFSGSDSFVDSLNKESRELLEEFQAREIQMAVSSFRCQAGHLEEIAEIADRISEEIIANGVGDLDTP